MLLSAVADVVFTVMKFSFIVRAVTAVLSHGWSCFWVMLVRISETSAIHPVSTQCRHTETGFTFSFMTLFRFSNATRSNLMID
jgi:hypothetical protein